MKAIFLGGIFPNEIEKEIMDRTIGQPQKAADLLQKNIISGLDSYLEEPITILNSLFIGSYPIRYTSAFIKSFNFKHSNLENSFDYNLKFLNLPLIKQISRYNSIKKALKTSVNISNYDVIIGYSMTEAMVSGLLYAKKINPKIKTCLVVPDLPEYMNLSKKPGLIYNILKTVSNKDLYKKIEKIDSFVILTEKMKDKLKIGKRQYSIVEGMIDGYNKKSFVPIPESNKKSIVYTGTLDFKYGVVDLVDAFHKLTDKNVELIICGAGDSKNYIEDLSKIDERIKFLGVVKHDKAVELQEEAFLLVNPRNNVEEYTNYSFPSKTLEYMNSGRPILMYRLGGIPDEYNKFIFYIDEFGSIYEGLKYCLDKSLSDMNMRGRNMQEFVRKNKTSKIQAKKIFDMINRIK